MRSALDARPDAASFMNGAEAQLLQAYNRWANERIFKAAADVGPEQLTRNLGMSYGSAWGTLVHIVWGEWLWLGRWQRARPGPGPDPHQCGDLPSLRDRWAEVERAQRSFVDQLTDAALAERISYENPRGVTWTYPLSEMVRHVVNHSTYHRGQVTTSFRHLGATPVATDFLLFLDDTHADAAPGKPSPGEAEGDGLVRGADGRDACGEAVPMT
jgi:uncharacterized damage-inducible protein DinB